ncbi:MAG: hypothetical protein IJR60_00215 [Eubacterium sp.]|nr:hypothetical protein [Eubacterium sp.]
MRKSSVKKLLSIVLALLMVMTTVPLGAFSALADEDVLCPVCKNGTDVSTCTVCSHTGYIKASETITCPKCKGENSASCTVCKGAGTIKRIAYGQTAGDFTIFGSFDDEVEVGNTVTYTLGFESGGSFLSDPNAQAYFFSEDDSIATAGETTGVITGVSPGSTKIDCYMINTDLGYTYAATLHAKITVPKATPTVSVTASDICKGESLEDSELTLVSAKVGETDVTGRLEWADSDPSSTVPPVGNNLAGFTFVPDDQEKYNNASGTTTVKVLDVKNDVNVMYKIGDSYSSSTPDVNYSAGLELEYRAIIPSDNLYNGTWTVANTSVATVKSISSDTKTVTLSVHKPGVIKLKVTGKNNASEAVYGTAKVTVNKGSYNPQFTTSAVSLKYGTDSTYKNTFKDGTVPTDAPAPTYSFVNGSGESLISSIADDGTVTFTDEVTSGTATVTASFAANDYYDAKEVSYTINMSMDDADDTSYEITTAKNGYNDDLYYTANPLVVKPVGTNKISKLPTRVLNYWDSEQLTFSVSDGNTNQISFYVKDSDGNIKKKTISNIKVDTTKPQVTGFYYADSTAKNSIENFINTITFDFFKNDVDIIITGSDATTSVKQFKVTLHDTKNNTTSTQTVDAAGNEARVTVSQEFEGYVTAIAIDAAKLESEEVSTATKDINAYTVVDKTKPELKVSLKNATDGYQYTTNGIAYYTKEKTLVLAVNETYLLSRINKQDGAVKINATLTAKNPATGKAIDVGDINEELTEPDNWNIVGGEYVFEKALPVEAEYTFAVNSLSDMALNDADINDSCYDEYSRHFVYDKTNPSIAVEFKDGGNGVGADDKYFNNKNDKRKLIITVKDDDFIVGNRNVGITATLTVKSDTVDKNGDSVYEYDYNSNDEFNNLLANPGNWTHLKEGENYTDKYQFTYEIPDEGHFTLKIDSLNDALGNNNVLSNVVEKADKFKENSIYYEKNSKDFIVDWTAPSVLITEEKDSTDPDNDEHYADNYYETQRLLRIRVTEHNFDGATVKIDTSDIDGALDLDYQTYIDNAKDKANWTVITTYGEEPVYEYTIPIDRDAQYEISAKSTDLAGNYDKDDSTDSIGFTVDKVAPSKVKFKFKKTSLTTFLNIVTFGIFFNDPVGIEMKAADKTSGLWKGHIEIADKNGNVIVDLDSDDNDGFKLFENGTKVDSVKFTLDEEKLATVKSKQFKGSIQYYVKDKSGNTYQNYGYVINGRFVLDETGQLDVILTDDDGSTTEQTVDNNVVYESIDAHVKNTAITIAPEKGVKKSVQRNTATEDEFAKQQTHFVSAFCKTNEAEYNEADKDYSFHKNAPLFSDDTTFNITMTQKHAGIKKYRIIVFNAHNGNKTYINTPKTAELKNGTYPTTVKEQITVKANANDIVILVVLQSGCGNVSYDVYNFGIDKTAPKLKATFKTNGKATQNKGYYNKKTTYTMEIKDRNLPAGDEYIGTVSYKLDGKKVSKKLYGKNFAASKNTSYWSNDYAYTYTLTNLTKEGTYEDFRFDAADRAKNKSDNASKMVFYYDHTSPKITVTETTHTGPYNGKYYQRERVIRVVVQDRFFKEKGFSYNMKAGSYRFIGDSQASKKYPDNNRRFTYEFTFRPGSANYSSIDCVLNALKAVDLAKNSATHEPPANGNDFTVDAAAPTGFKADIVDDTGSTTDVRGSEYKAFATDKIVLRLSCTDGNLLHAKFSDETLTCEAISSRGNESEVLSVKSTAKHVSRNEVSFTFDNLEKEGFYKLAFTVTDDANNTSETQSVRFAICRNGALINSDDFRKIEDKKPVGPTEVKEVVKFHMYSASPNADAIITVSNNKTKKKELVEGVDYTMNTSNKHDKVSRRAYEYEYVFEKSAFCFEKDENGNYTGDPKDGDYLVTVIPTVETANHKIVKGTPDYFTVNMDSTDPTIAAASIDFVPTYGRDTVNEKLQVSLDSEEAVPSNRFFTNSGTLILTIKDNTGIDESSIEVTWNGKELECTPVDKDVYEVKVSSADEANDNVILIKAKDVANNDIEASFNLNLDNHFWIYVAIGGFGALAVLAVAILLIIARRKRANASDVQTEAEADDSADEE